MGGSGLKIRCLITCNVCGLKEFPAEVSARGPENVIEWMDAARVELAAAHTAASPDCQATSLSELKIPHTDGRPVGAPRVH